MAAHLFDRMVTNALDRSFSAARVVPLSESSLIFVSGEIGRDQTGKLIGGGFWSVARLCFASIDRTLRSAMTEMQCDEFRVTPTAWGARKR